MKLALVHQGGGAKGAFGAGAIRALNNRGYKFEFAYGTSVGGLNTAAYAKGGPDLLDRIWKSVTERDIFKRFSTATAAWRLLNGQKNLYDFRPLHELVLRELGPGPYGNRVGVVDLVTGRHEVMDGDHETIYASASMPIFADPVRGYLVDGGVRKVTPLAEAIDCGADAVVVILCSPRAPSVAQPPKNMLDVGLRTMDLVWNQIANYDIQIATQINELVKLAEEQGQVILSPSGKPYRYIPIMVVEPPFSLGETLDFSRKVLDDRYALGTETVTRLTAGKGPRGYGAGMVPVIETEPKLQRIGK